MEDYNKIMRILTNVYHKRISRHNATKQILFLFTYSYHFNIHSFYLGLLIGILIMLITFLIVF